MNAPARQSLDRVFQAPPVRPLALQRKCACGAAAPDKGGTCERCKSRLQAKLAVGPVDDPLEHEADRIAERVMASSAADPAGAAPVRAQRAGGDGTGSMETAPPSVESTLAATGRPLESGLRHDMEQRFGHSFFDVRVHDDALAQASARDVGAAAYTAGAHIVFAAGRYTPGSRAGRQLIAHELAHVLQQTSAGALPLRRRIQRQAQPAGPAEQQGVARMKWSEESERMYRNTGDVRAANAIRGCRLQGGAACAMLVTEEEAAAIVAREARPTGAGGTGTTAAAGAPLAAGVMLGPALPPVTGGPPLPPFGPVTPMPPIPGSGGLGGLGTELAARAATATPATATGGGGIVGVAGPLAAVGLVGAASTYAAWRYTEPQRILIARGYIILRPPLAVCIGGCHIAAPRPDTFPRLFPDTGGASARDLDRIREYLQPRAPTAGTPQPGPTIAPPTFPMPFPLDLSRRQRGRSTGPTIIPRVDPRTGEEVSSGDPCDYSPMKKCVQLSYEFDSVASAAADLRTRWPNMQTSGTQGSTSGDCFADGNPRGPQGALSSGATHTTYRIPGVAGADGVIASVVCCNCCMSIPGIDVPMHEQRCTIVKERSAPGAPAAP